MAIGLQTAANNQSNKGEALSFIEESEPGDLAFLTTRRDYRSRRNHHGEQNYVIHSFGSDPDRTALDHTGIFIPKPIPTPQTKSNQKII